MFRRLGRLRHKADSDPLRTKSTGSSQEPTRLRHRQTFGSSVSPIVRGDFPAFCSASNTHTHIYSTHPSPSQHVSCARAATALRIGELRPPTGILPRESFHANHSLTPPADSATQGQTVTVSSDTSSNFHTYTVSQSPCNHTCYLACELAAILPATLPATLPAILPALLPTTWPTTLSPASWSGSRDGLGDCLRYGPELTDPARLAARDSHLEDRRERREDREQE